MTMGVRLDDIEMSPEERAAVDEYKRQFLAEIEGLEQMRKLVDLTQKQMAEALHVSQSSVHQIEKRTDLYLSTLRRFVEAAGGTLELRVSFPGRGEFKLSGIGDVAT